MVPMVRGTALWKRPMMVKDPGQWILPGIAAAIIAIMAILEIIL